MSRTDLSEQSNILRKADKIWSRRVAETRKFFENLFDWFISGEIDVAEVDNLLQLNIPILTKEDRAEIIQLLLNIKHELEIGGEISE